MLLDVARIVELRLNAGLSQRALARALGVSSPTITRLEVGRGHDRLTLHRLVQLADALGTSPGDLLAVAASDSASAGHDDRVVEAALARSQTMIRTAELADGLGWEIQRASDALAVLRSRLRETGSSLVRTPNGWALRSREDLLTSAQRRNLERARRGRRGITVSDARLLFDVLEGRIDSGWEQRAANAQRVTLASLLKAGYIHKTGNRYELTPAIAATLARGPLPPAQPGDSDQQPLGDDVAAEATRQEAA